MDVSLVVVLILDDGPDLGQEPALVVEFFVHELMAFLVGVAIVPRRSCRGLGSELTRRPA
jgi:hypothetical protein